VHFFFKNKINYSLVLQKVFIRKFEQALFLTAPLPSCQWQMQGLLKSHNF
jgi:hypothetical protein